MTDSTAPRRPTGLDKRGRELWAAMVATRDLAGGNATLAEEACRIADRLDVLNRVLTGDGRTWITLRLPRDSEDPDVLTVVVDKALAEARQQANILRQIVAGLPVRGADDDDDADGFLDGL